MTAGFKGMGNAYKNVLADRARLDLQDDVGDTSFLGFNSWGAKLQGIWSHVVFYPALAKGFILGEDKKVTPTVDIPDTLKNTEWAKDVGKFNALKQEEINLRVDSTMYLIGGIFTLNMGKFNEGRAMGEAIDHLRAKQLLTLPARSPTLAAEAEALSDRRARPEAPRIEVPNVPNDIVKTLQRN